MLSLTHSREGRMQPQSIVSAQNVDVSLDRKDISSACLCGSRLPLQVRLGLRSRTRPVVEGRWCCSEACLHARVSAFVRRGASMHSMPSVQHPHRIPLGLLLLSQGAITQEQLRFARQMSETSGERLGDILVRHCGLSVDRLLRGIATQWGCFSWDASGILPHGMACIAPHVVLCATGMLPLRVQEDGSISVAFLDAPDASAVFALRRIHERSVDAGIAGARPFQEALSQLQSQEAVSVDEQFCTDEEDVVRRLTRAIQRYAPVESRWVRLHGMVWMRMWLEPAAVAGGFGHRNDVMDLVLHVPSVGHRVSKLKSL